MFRKSGDIVDQALKEPGAPSVSNKERKRMVTAKCRELANQLANVIQKGRLFNAFLFAGERCKVSASLAIKLEEAYAAYLADPENPEKLARLEELEEEGAKDTVWEAAGGDPEKLKALDFHNDMAEGFYLYDICARKHCGIYMRSDYWLKATNAWRFKCWIQWPVVRGKDPTVAATMVEKYGEDMDKWPQPGCGAKFSPWAKGPSKIIELQMPDGNWQAIRAMRLPQKLDDEIKKVLLEFHEASGQVTAEEILENVPMVFPKTHKTDVPGVSRFDVEDWIKKDSPTLTESGWVALCELIAEKNVADLGCILTLCRKMTAE